MADPIQSVVGILSAAGAVTSLVSDRISPRPLQQGEALPSIVLTVVATTPFTHLQGSGSLHEVRVQVDCYGSTYAAAAGLGDAVRAALEASDRILASRLDDFDEATQTHVVSMDFLLWITPA